MKAIFDLLAIPLGWLMGIIYNLVPKYLLAIFLFTLLVRIILFPLSLKTQKSQADRARLAPRLERIKKKYEKDPKKQQQKQKELYEKHGVSMTGGCMPMIVQMLVLFGIISVIYSPLQHIAGIPKTAVDAAVESMHAEQIISDNDAKGYYREMHMLKNLEGREEKVLAAIKAQGYTDEQATTYLKEMQTVKKDFVFFGKNMLENPWNGGFAGISVLWLIPLISGITAFFSSLLSLHYTKQMTAAENQQAQGCSNVMMLVWMPAFSLFITFTVPGGVGVYWICSNVISLLQTYVLNQIYNPAKIRAQAEIEYEERRRKKQEDKKRLAEARAKEQRELAAQQKEENKPAKNKKAAEAPVEETPAEDAQPEPKDE